MGEKVGVVGVPPWGMMAECVSRGDEIIDLDEPHKDFPVQDGFLPVNYCAILKRVVSNIHSLREAGRLDRVIACVGDDKCDGMRYIARYLTVTTDIPITLVRNDNAEPHGTPISDSGLPLRTKVELIVQGVFKTPRLPKPLQNVKPVCGFWGVPPHGRQAAIEIKVKPVCGFWGVPPCDFDILDLFPDRTHVFGWTRCMENKTPGDFEMECHVGPGIPVVFFTQSFCQKASLAFNLARKHGGLFVEVDSGLSRSARAKVEAFLRFNVKG